MTQCPNCSSSIENHPDDSCVLNMMFGVLRDRGEHTEEQIAALWKKANPDHLWDDVGPLIDSLGEGHYDCEARV